MAALFVARLSVANAPAGISETFVRNIPIVMLRLAMSQAHRRPKAPDIVRERILSATSDILARGAPLSLASVAVQAGVTKGAVQHHFGTREELLSCLFLKSMARFEDVMRAVSESDSGPGSATRAYVRAAIDTGYDDTEMRSWKALIVATVIDRGLAARWGEWVRQDRAHDTSINELIMRLASDGLWLSDVLGLYDISPTERSDLRKALLDLTIKGQHE